MNITTVHQPTYLPYMGTLAKIDASNIYVMYDSADYSRREFMARNRIKGKNGVTWINIPVHGHQKMPIREVKIDGRDWVKKNLASVKHAYTRSRWFDKYYPEFCLALSLRSDWLLDYLISTNLWLFAALNIHPTFYLSSELADLTDLGPGTKLAVLTKDSGGDCYLAGPAWSHYMSDIHEFTEMGLAFSEAEIHCEPYPAINGYEPNLSVLDLLFSVEEPLPYIKKSITVKMIDPE